MGFATRNPSPLRLMMGFALRNPSYVAFVAFVIAGVPHPQNNVTPGTSHNDKPASALPITVAASTSLG